MKNFLSAIAIFAGIAIGNAQVTGQVANYNGTSADGGVSDALYRYAMGSIKDVDSKTDYSNERIEGSPYLANTFQPTTVFYGDEKAGDIYFRYNAFNEEVELKQQNVEQEPIRALSRDKKIKILVGGKSMSFKTFIDKKGKTLNGYLTLVRDGNFKLYKRLNVTFKDEQKAANSFVKGTPARFSQFTEYYIESEDGNRIDQVQFSNKGLLKLFKGEKQSALKNYLKENKIKVSDENDLYQVMSFLNG